MPHHITAQHTRIRVHPSHNTAQPSHKHDSFQPIPAQSIAFQPIASHPISAKPNPTQPTPAQRYKIHTFFFPRIMLTWKSFSSMHTRRSGKMGGNTALPLNLDASCELLAIPGERKKLKEGWRWVKTFDLASRSLAVLVKTLSCRDGQPSNISAYFQGSRVSASWHLLNLQRRNYFLKKRTKNNKNNKK